ncbi:hypothetical protein Pan153_34270 [Gimesia panareensis]|uniref:Uncharacterized protein n=1 Tax=Gimesia panareensis TaxID=2527978 RepID=A0A518FQZ0_9PLAN|nr:hypothetical protein Enr10x_33670 [Gimesia panareensis]QDU50896.1 hypothetical protein Pan110_32570 [Gimesia panareensis]QDV18766.1 hypothetical protein Pan153_34270 [Gimesia panareensis]
MNVIYPTQAGGHAGPRPTFSLNRVFFLSLSGKPTDGPHKCHGLSCSLFHKYA